MADLCVCGHEERRHYDAETCEGVFGVCDTYDDYGSRCHCDFYTRDPQRSAFRGTMRWTREDAAAALDLLGFTHSADAARFGDLRRRRASMHELLDCARYDLACGSACRHENAALGLLAARILRAVRP